MAPLDSERWHRASPHLDRILDLPPDEREACLASLRAQDPAVAADVEALLAEHRLLSAEGFLEDSAHIPTPPRTIRVAGAPVRPASAQRDPS